MTATVSYTVNLTVPETEHRRTGQSPWSLQPTPGRLRLVPLGWLGWLMWVWVVVLRFGVTRLGCGCHTIPAFGVRSGVRLSASQWRWAGRCSWCSHGFGTATGCLSPGLVCWLDLGGFVKVLKRLGARRRLVVGIAVLSVVATGAGLSLSAGVAAATANQVLSPCDGGGHDVCLLPGSAAYAISSGTTGAAAPWIIALNDSSAGTVGSSLWATGDQIFVTVTFHGGTAGGAGGNALAAQKFVEFAQSGSIIAEGQGCNSNVPAPTATVTAGTYAGDQSGNTGLTDTLDIKLTNSATPGATVGSHSRWRSSTRRTARRSR